MKLLHLVFITVLLTCPAKAESRLLELGMTTGDASTISHAVLKAAYAKLGIEIIGRPMPGKRSLLEADLGNSDGEVSRIADIEPEHPNLIRITIPVDEFTMSAISFAPGSHLATLDDIRTLKVGIRSGIRFAEMATAGMPEVFCAQDWDTVFDMLKIGRIDVVLATPHTWLKQRNREGFETLYLHNPPLKTQRLYHYLHKRNADLVPEITSTLKEMHDAGDIEIIRNRQLMSSNARNQPKTHSP